MSLRDIKDDLLSLRSALYQNPGLDAPVAERITAILNELNREIGLQEAEHAKLPLPPGWSSVLVRKMLPLSDPELADAMRDVSAGLDPSERRAVRYRDVLVITSPGGIVTECHDDEDRYAKLLADRDNLLAQLKTVEAARDAERMERLSLSTQLTSAEQKLCELGQWPAGWASGSFKPEPDLERWVVSEIDVEDGDRSYYDLHVGDVWTRIPGTLMLGRSSAKGSLTARFPLDGTAFAPFSCGRGVKFVADVTGAEPAPEPERAPEIIKQVELAPTRGYDPALERRAKALADALFVKLYPTTGGTLMLRDRVAKDRHAEHLRHARAVLGLRP